jgi:allophanate hydrolase subunit 2
MSFSASQFNSKSTVPSLKFGGVQGRQLQKSDSIALSKQSQEWADEFTPFELHSTLIPSYSIPYVYVMNGPHDSNEIMTPGDRQMLYTTTWKVGHNSNRSGVRLVGPSPQWARSDGGEAGAHPSNYCEYVDHIIFAKSLLTSMTATVIRLLEE